MADERIHFSLNDSGAREEFDTGSRRDTQEGKGRYDLIPYEPLRQLAVLYEAGAKKYGDKNWELGQPLSRYVSSGMRHLQHVNNADVDENHPIQAAWNMFAIAFTVDKIRKGELSRDLDDIGYIDALENAEVDQGDDGDDGPTCGHGEGNAFCVCWQDIGWVDEEPHAYRWIADYDEELRRQDRGYVFPRVNLDRLVTPKPASFNLRDWVQDFLRRASEPARSARLIEEARLRRAEEQAIIDRVKIRPLNVPDFWAALATGNEVDVSAEHRTVVQGTDVFSDLAEPVEAVMAEEADDAALDLTLPDWAPRTIEFELGPIPEETRRLLAGDPPNGVQDSLDTRG